MNYLFALVAGLLTTLSPCVLPVLPFVTASSLSKSIFGPLFLTAGLVTSFVCVAILVSSSGFLLGIDPHMVRSLSGVLLFLSGLLFLSQRLSNAFANSLSALTGRAAGRAPLKDKAVLVAEFASGFVLGVVWTPCSGPSLGAALALAAQSGSAVMAATVLATFALGASIPLLAVAYGARRVIATFKKNSRALGTIKKVFGALMMLFGFLIACSLDRKIEATLTAQLPDAWLDFITRF